MDVTHPPLVDPTHLGSLVGRSSLDRGRTYARGKRVTGLRWDGRAQQLSGSVKGHGDRSYSTTVKFRITNHGFDIHTAQCSCPVQLNCKHVAAVLLTSNSGLSVRELTPDRNHLEPGGRQEALWEDQLESLIAPHEPRRQPSFTPLGLQFELREEPSGGRGRNSSRAAGTADRASRVRLAIRPVMRNENDRWVKGHMDWNSVSVRGYRNEFDPAQLKWLSTFAALHRGRTNYYGGETWLYLEDFSNPLLWNLLRQAADCGIALVAARQKARLTVHEPASVSLDLRTAEDGLLLEPMIDAGGDTLDPASLAMIGNPAHGLFWWEPTLRSNMSLTGLDIHLAPTVETLPGTVRDLLAARQPLLIPASDSERFMDSYYPLLRQETFLVSSDDSVEFPYLPEPTLVLSASYRSNKLSLGWHWEYAGNGQVNSRPLVPGGAGYRDTRFETETVQQTASALQGYASVLTSRLAASDDGATNFATGDDGSVQLIGIDAALFTEDVLPRLRTVEALRVDIDGTVPDFSELTATPQISVSTESTDDHDWFDLGVSVDIEGQDIPFGNLFRALASGEEHLMLSNGNYFALDQPEFTQLRQLIEEARALQENNDELRISRYQAGLWDELADLATNTEQAESWRQSVNGLLQFTEMPETPVPAGLDAELRPYQQTGFSWLAFLWERKLGGVLADDMGLGKTLQALALITHAKEAAEQAATESTGTDAGEADGATLQDGGAKAVQTPMPPFMVVAPTSVVPNWVSEIRRFAPGLRAVAVTDTLARSDSDPAHLAGAADVVVISYTLFRLDFAAYNEHQWSGLILDEAQFVKNRATKISSCAREFAAPFKLAITGTPMENNLMELWSLFAVTAPGLFPRAGDFADYYQKPVEKDADTDRLRQLRQRIRPLMMRRTKEAVATELPAKQEQILELELAPRHRKVYQLHLQRERQKVLGLIEDMNANRFAIFRSLTLLRRLSLDASLVDEKYAAIPSSKLDVLFEQLNDILAEGHRTLIFSQFTGFLKQAAARLDAAGIEYAYLDGSTRRRAEVINKFKSGQAPVFLISLKAGGFGLNLTEADYCFLLDPWWNPATEAQAVDRTHRIGQTKKVMVYRMVAKDTIEEKVMALKEKKAKLFTSVMDDDAMFSSALTSDDVRGLFAS